jgi:hypothetical protein
MRHPVSHDVSTIVSVYGHPPLVWGEGWGRRRRSRTLCPRRCGRCWPICEIGDLLGVVDMLVAALAIDPTIVARRRAEKPARVRLFSRV